MARVILGVCCLILAVSCMNVTFTNEKVFMASPGLTGLLKDFKSTRLVQLKPFFGAGLDLCTVEMLNMTVPVKNRKKILFFDYLEDVCEEMTIVERIEMWSEIGIGAVAVVERFGTGRHAGLGSIILTNSAKEEDLSWLPIVSISLTDYDKIILRNQSVVHIDIATAERNEFIEVSNHFIIYLFQVVMILIGFGLMIFGIRNFIMFYQDQKNSNVLTIQVIVLVASCLTILFHIIALIDFIGARLLFSIEVYTFFFGGALPIAVTGTLGVSISWNTILSMTLNRKFSEVERSILIVLFIVSIILSVLMFAALLIYTFTRNIIPYAILTAVYLIIFLSITIYYTNSLIKLLSFPKINKAKFVLDKYIAIAGFSFLILFVIWNFLYKSAVERAIVHAGVIVSCYMVSYSNLTFTKSGKKISNTGSTQSQAERK